MPITQISDSSWDGIMKIQQEAYTELPPEDLNVLKKKWLSSPSTCFIFSNDTNEILAYLLSHPWTGECPPKLNEDTEIYDEFANLYLHDLALCRSVRGLGIAKAMVMYLIKNAKERGILQVMLVAVQNSSSFWERFGFVAKENADICSSYGSSATLMILDLNR